MKGPNVAEQNCLQKCVCVYVSLYVLDTEYQKAHTMYDRNTKTMCLSVCERKRQEVRASGIMCVCVCV